MATEPSNSVRRVFLSALFDGLHVTWPILSGLIVFKVCLGAVVGLAEGWGVWKGIYFAFVTGLTIGYGDFVPQRTATQILAIVIGFAGIVLTGLIVALAVRALQATAHAFPTTPSA